jgi:NTE family protein
MHIPAPNDVIRRDLPDAAIHSPKTRRAERQAKRRRLSLALQGGGSFGAFTWGVLDRLLEEEDLAFDVASGASAGAINAVVMATGLAKSGRKGGREEARARLTRFWTRVSEVAPRASSNAAAAMATRLLSPYQFNPFNVNPLRTILSEEVDFDALRAKPPLRLLIAATRVSDGSLRVFREKAVTLEAVLASACLPLLHHAVEIDGEAYWDGAYSANPPIVPLIAASRASDALVVQIIPTASEETPTSSADIIKRMQQITFNSSLLREMEALSAMTKLSGPDAEGSALSRKLQRLRLHHINAEKHVPGLAQASALDLDWDFLCALRDHGRAAAEGWLAAKP